MIPLDLPPKLIIPEKPGIVQAYELPKPAILNRIRKKEPVNPLLAMPFHAGFRARPNSVPDITIGSVGDRFVSGTDTTVYNCTGLPAVGASERALIGFLLRRSAATSVTSVTIGGAACTPLYFVSKSDNNVHHAWYLGPVGGTGTVTITVPAALLRMMCFLYPCANIQNTSVTDSFVYEAGSLTMSGNIDCLAGGAVFAMAGNQNSSMTTTWTGLTENFEGPSIETNYWVSGASQVFAAAQTNLAVQAVMAGSLNVNMMSAISIR